MKESTWHYSNNVTQKIEVLCRPTSNTHLDSWMNENIFCTGLKKVLNKHLTMNAWTRYMSVAIGQAIEFVLHTSCVCDIIPRAINYKCHFVLSAVWFNQKEIFFFGKSERAKFRNRVSLSLMFVLDNPDITLTPWERRSSTALWTCTQQNQFTSQFWSKLKCKLDKVGIIKVSMKHWFEMWMA